MSAALALSCQGHRVTLIEQHAQLGGKLRVALVGDAKIDCGPTVFTMKPVFDQLFALAGTRLEEHVTLQSADVLARHFWLDHPAFDLFSNVDKTCDEIVRVFDGKEADNYRRFAERTEEVFTTLDESFMRTQKPSPIGLTFSHGLSGIMKLMRTQPFSTLWSHLSKEFNSPQLQQLFARYATYCGSSPYQAPATLMLIAHAERQGVWYLKNGMYSLVQAVEALLQKHEATIRLNTSVAEILTNSRNEVVSVVLDNGETLTTDAVIHAGDTSDLSNGGLGKAAMKAVPNRTEPSLSAITRSDVATVSGVQLAHHNVFFSNDYQAEFDELFKHKDVPSHPTLYVCAQDRSDLNSVIGPERLFTLANAPAVTLSEEQIAKTVSSIPQWLAQYNLAIDCQHTPTVDSPNSFAQLFPSTSGALYGRPTHGMMGSFLRPGSTSSVKGLFLAGASVHPGAGIPMVCLSGMLAADALDRWLNT